MLDFLEQGGKVMYVIALCSVGALAVIIERVVTLAMVAREENGLIRKVSETFRTGTLDEAVDVCESSHAPTARVCGAALAKHGSPRDEIRDAAQDEGARELKKLSKRLVILSTIAHVAPLLGLLGTVVGLYDTFLNIEEVGGGRVDTGILSAGIRKALLTTAFGLSVAIPAFIANSALAAWVNRIIDGTERVAGAAVELISSHDGAST